MTYTHSALGNPSYLALATEQYFANGSGLLGNPSGDLLGWCSREEKDVLTRHGRRSGSGRDFGRLISIFKLHEYFISLAD